MLQGQGYMCIKLAKLLIKKKPVFAVLTRAYGTSDKQLKRFYKNVSISQAEDGFEVNLDTRKLKTPNGNVFRVPSEPLALIVATEWESQLEFIKRHRMHMTTLCNIAIDNPTNRSQDSVITSILEFLDTDTISYRVNEPTEFANMQAANWDPLLHWVHDRYGVQLQATTGLVVPVIPDVTRSVFVQHLQSYSDWALVGYQEAVESIKSFVITCALVDRHLTVEQAVDLARLEQLYQSRIWGNVEWHHDIDVMTTRARLAAAILLVHLSSNDARVVFDKAATNKPI